MCYYDIPEDLWLRLEPILPTEGSPRGGRPIGDVRNFLNAVHWMLRTGSPWRALPEKYGSWKTVYSRFRRWQKRGYLTAILKLLTLQADMNHIMIDGTYVHAHKHSAGARHTLESIRLSAEVVAALLPKFMRWWMLSVICWLLLSRQDNTPSIHIWVSQRQQRTMPKKHLHFCFWNPLPQVALWSCFHEEAPDNFGKSAGTARATAHHLNIIKTKARHFPNAYFLSISIQSITILPQLILLLFPFSDIMEKYRTDLFIPFWILSVNQGPIFYRRNSPSNLFIP